MNLHTRCAVSPVATLLCLLVFAASTSHGASKIWVPTTGGDWTTADNWSPSGAPGAGDDVTISSDQSAPITAVPTISLASLTVNGNASLVAAANGNVLTITGSFVVAPGKTLLLGDDANGRMEFTLAATATGTVSGTVTIFSQTTARVFTNSGDLTVGSAGLINGTESSFVLSANATLRIGSVDGITAVGTASGNIQTTGARTFDAGANYVYDGTANQNTGTGLPDNLTGTLTIDNPGNTVSLNAARTIASGGSLVLTGGTFAAGTNLSMATTSAITRGEGSMTGTLQGSGVYNVTYTGNAKFTGAELSGSGLADLTVNLTAGQDLTLSAAVSINGNLTIGAGATLEAGTFSHQLKGNLVSSGWFAASSSTVTLNGATAQTIGGTSVTFNNLTVDNAAGISINSDVTVNGTLTLTSGNIETGANALIVGPSGTVSRTSGHIVGNLRLNFGTGDVAAKVFPIGTATAYTPLSLDIDGADGTAGTITASTTGTAHPDAANSGVDVAKDVERYWTLTAGTAVLGARTYSLKVEFLSGDVPVGANTNAFIFSRKDGSSGIWSEPTGGTYARTGTSTEYSNFTSLSDFVVGELKTYSITGTILSGAVGLDGASVAASGGFTGSGTSNASGVYTISGIPRNTRGISLTPTLAGYGFTPPSRTATGPVTADVTGQDFAAADTVAPTVVSYTPADNATGVATGANLVLTFNENVAKGTGSIQIRKSSDSSVVETIDVATGPVSITGAVVTIDPVGALIQGTGYFVNIAAGAIKDLANNPFTGISDAITWNFTTVSTMTDFLVEAEGGGAISRQRPNVAFAIKITARDGSGNTYTAFTGSVDITSSGSLSSGGGATASFVNGVLASHSVTISNTGSFTITATKPTTLETGTSNSFDVSTSTILYVSASGSDITGDGSLPLPFKTIGKGVSAALAKDTVVVLEGIYTETVNITKSMALLAWGPGEKIIRAPAGFESTSPTAYDYALAGFVTERALVHIGTTAPINVVLRGFTVDVNTLGPPHAAAIAYGGILAEKCSVTVVQNVVKNVLPQDGVSIWHSGKLYNGRGVEVRGSGSVAVIDSNTIQEVNRFHVLVNATDDTGQLPAVYPHAFVRDNTITGKGVSYAGGQKGVWFNHGAYGTISRNTISNFDFPSAAIEPERGTAIAIWREDINLSGITNVLDNTLTASTFVNNKGIYAWGIRDTIQGNVITGFRWGIELHNQHYPLVTRNTITGGVIGIMLGDERPVEQQTTQITIGGSPGNKNTITGQISPASGGRAITLAFRDPLNSEELKSETPVTATYNDFGVYTAAEIAERIFDRADTTLAKIDTVLFTPFMVPKTTLAVKAFLQGPYTTAGDSLQNALNKLGYLAGQFPGIKVPSKAVDAVTIEVRDSLATAKSTKNYSVPAWLMTNGLLRTFTDSTKGYVELPDSVNGDYYVVVRHRNHLAIMSSTRVACEGSTSPTPYDFTTAASKAYGTDAMKGMGAGNTAPFALYGGEANVDGQITSTDFNAFLPKFTSGATGYEVSDWNLDGQVTSSDFNIFLANFTAGRTTRVP